MQFLAATDFSTRSNRALRQAGLLAQPGRDRLLVVHVVDDDQPEELIRAEKREAKTSAGSAEWTRCQNSGESSAVPWWSLENPFDGILRVAPATLAQT